MLKMNYSKTIQYLQIYQSSWIIKSCCLIFVHRQAVRVRSLPAPVVDGKFEINSQKPAKPKPNLRSVNFSFFLRSELWHGRSWRRTKERFSESFKTNFGTLIQVSSLWLKTFPSVLHVFILVYRLELTPATSASSPRTSSRWRLVSLSIYTHGWYTRDVRKMETSPVSKFWPMWDSFYPFQHPLYIQTF